MIAVTFALPAESSRFRHFLKEITHHNRSGIRTMSGKIDNHSIELLHTGVGESICRQRIAPFLQDRQFDCLISAGFAGALADQLHVGDVLIARNFSTFEIDRTHSRLAHLPLRFADLHTAPEMIDSPAERQKIAQATGAMAVDMETEFIARACAEHGLPLLSLRVISDTPAEPFPARPDVLFDIASQRTNMTKLAAFFLTHPNRIPRLIQFARNISRAKATLADALVEGIRAIE